MFRVCIARCRGVPVRVEDRTDLFFLHGLLELKCYFQLPLLSWNEARAAGFHHLIQPLPGLNSIDFIKRVLRKG